VVTKGGGNDMIIIIIRVLIPLTISFFVGMLFRYTIRKNSTTIIENLTAEYIVVKLPSVYFWVGFIDIIVFITFVLLSLFSPKVIASSHNWVFAVFSFFIILGAILMISTITWRLELFRNNEYFFVRKFLKKEKIYFTDCKCYKYAQNKLIIYTDEKKYCIYPMCENFEFVLAFLVKHNVKDQSGDG